MDDDAKLAAKKKLQRREKIALGCILGVIGLWIVGSMSDHPAKHEDAAQPAADTTPPAADKAADEKPASTDETIATTVNNAYTLCHFFDSLGQLTEKCSVSGWSSSVNITADIQSGEARQVCKEAVRQMNEAHLQFKGGWVLNIYSPYSAGKTIAFCDLPRF